MKFVTIFYCLAVYNFSPHVTDANKGSQNTFNCVPRSQLIRHQNLQEPNAFEKNQRPLPDNIYNGHPLDPLSVSEIKKAKDIINMCLPTVNGWSFNTITLQEPPKDLIAPHFYKNEDPPKGSTKRQAFCIVRDYVASFYTEIVVNLVDGSIDSKKDLEQGVQPYFTDEDYESAVAVCLNNTELLSRCANLGYPDPNSILLENWPMSYVADYPRYVGKRLFQMLVYGIKYEYDNVYAHPFPFVVVVDILNRVILDFLETPCGSGSDIDNSNVTVPDLSANFDSHVLPADFYRTDLKPINISFPDGPSYKTVNYLINWQKFSFRVGFNVREGLVIYLVSYNDSGIVRPLVYRAAMSEVWVPYGDPRLPTGPLKRAFDEIEFGLGSSAMTMEENVDCVGGVQFFDGFVNDAKGNPEVIKNAICLHEDDAGILWRHKDEVSGKTSFARARRLVVSLTARLGNYEYIYSWKFNLDGSFDYSVDLTGVLSTTLLAQGSPPPPYGSQLSEQVMAVYHQHIFCVRLDLDIDGPLNSVSTVDMLPDPYEVGTPENYYGNGIITKTTLLNTTEEGITETSPATSRIWKISNDAHLHSVTNLPVSYMLKPANTPPTFWKRESPALDLSRYATHDMWVTPYKEKQLHAAGEYLKEDGLYQWVHEDLTASIVNQDIVLWHVFNLPHVPRIEDWPVMPVETTGFSLKPKYFFKQNPALDVPGVRNPKIDGKCVQNKTNC